jgi:leucyl aminopeptidase
MKFKLSQTDSTKNTCDTLVIALNESQLTPSATAVNSASNQSITALIDAADFKGSVGETLMVPLLPGVSAKRVLLVGFGEKSSTTDFIKGCQKAATALIGSATKEASLYLNEVNVEGRDDAWKARQQVIAIQSASYTYTETKSKPKTAPNVISVIEIAAPNQAEALAQGEAIGAGMNTAKELGNLPGNICTPSYLAEQAQELDAKCDAMELRILDEDEMEALNMGAFLSVSKGSIEPGKIICMNYQGGKKGDAPHMILGKGITFDTGGISLKPGAAMDEMKYDMGGAASIMGAMQAIVDLKLPINVLGMITSAENMPSGHASKPGDVVTTMAGKTIEILNTDAEGRLVLCDALAFGIETYKPASIVDVATLTGACMMALGGVCSGYFTQNEALASELEDAANTSQDKVWRLPLMDEYQELLDTNFADIANIGGRLAGATTAACFLSRFTEGQQWAHLDIAGTAWGGAGKAKGSTGRPVPLLVQYLMNKV